MRTPVALLAVAVALVSVMACSSSQNQAQKPSTATATTTSTTQSGKPTSTAASMAPVPSSSDFVAGVTNPWFPLKPGSKWVYKGVKDGAPNIDTFVVTTRKRVVQGVSTTVVMDVTTSGKRVVEATEDWYAQDKQGNVWYFGENTKEFDKSGKVDTSGSWEAGVGGAKAGLFMPANPQIGMSFYQEYLKGEAEDTFKIVSLTATIAVPAGTYNTTLMTEESTVLEPGIITQKNYAKGIGEVYENDTKGPAEYSKLATYTVK